MARRLSKYTYEFVKKSFGSEGYVLLSTTYVNCSYRLEYICPKGHQHSIDWSHWIHHKNRCPSCGDITTANKRRTSIVKIKLMFEEEGYVLLTKEYKNPETELYYICNNGHKHKTNYRTWLSGSRCPSCNGGVRLAYEYVRKSFEKEGYSLLSDKYINWYTKLDYVCANEHRHSIAWTNWQKGHRCPSCANQRVPSVEEVRASFNEEDYTLLSKVYVNNRTKLNYVCPAGHNNSITWTHWQRGGRCSTCLIVKREEQCSGLSGMYCGAWQDVEYKQDIKDRDNNMCINPYCYKTDSLLSIHHIDYNKQNCKPSNLITVCRACNSRANKDRKWHTAWYQTILKRRYNYDY